MINPTFVNLAYMEDADDVAIVLQNLYNEYASRVDFANSLGFNRDGDEVGKRILDEEDWFRAVLKGEL